LNRRHTKVGKISRRDVCSSRDVRAGLDVVAIAVVKLFFIFISVMILSLPSTAIATVELTHSVNARLAMLERAIVKAVLSVCPSFRHKCPDPGHLTSLTHRTACSIDPIQAHSCSCHAQYKPIWFFFVARRASYVAIIS